MLAGYAAYKPFTVRNTHIDENLANFRLLVRITADADIGARARADGHDIRFTLSDGSTLIAHERVSFAIANGLATAIFWLKPPSLSATAANAFQIHFGNPAAADGASPSATWGTSSYHGVWHLDGGLLDSSGNGRDGTDYDTADALGQVGRSRLFNAAAPSRVDTGEWTATGDVTLLAWVYTNSTSSHVNIDDQAIVGKAVWGGDGPGDFIFKMRYASGPNRLVFLRHSLGYYAAVTDTRSLAANTWHRVGVSYRAAAEQATIYVNGEAGGSGNMGGVMPTNAHHVFLGVQEAGLRMPWSGHLDEVMAMASPASAAWMKFDYYQQSTADNEITWGTLRLAHTASVADPAKAYEALAARQAVLRSLADGAKSGDGQQAAVDCPAALQVAAHAGDALTPLAQLNAVGLSASTAGDLLASLRARGAGAAEASIASDALDVRVAALANIADEAQAADHVQAAVDCPAALQEAAIAGDTLTPSARLNAVCLSATTAGDLLAPVRARDAGAAEASIARDALDVRVAALANVEDEAQATDALSADRIGDAITVDTTAAGDAVVAIAGRLANVTAASQAADSLEARITAFLDLRGRYRIFAEAEYRFFRSQLGPPTAADRYATSESLPYTPAEPFTDGTWYLACSFYNGLVDSDFLPIGPHGEPYLRLDLDAGQATRQPPAAPGELRLELVAGGVVRLVGLYAELGELRADEWAIATTTDGTDPPADAPTLTIPFTGTSQAQAQEILDLRLAAQPHGTPIAVRIQVRRNDGTEPVPVWTYSENSPVLTTTADAEGPTAPLYFVKDKG